MRRTARGLPPPSLQLLEPDVTCTQQLPVPGVPELRSTVLLPTIFGLFHVEPYTLLLVSTGATVCSANTCGLGPSPFIPSVVAPLVLRLLGHCRYVDFVPSSQLALLPLGPPLSQATHPPLRPLPYRWMQVLCKLRCRSAYVAIGCTESAVMYDPIYLKLRSAVSRSPSSTVASPLGRFK